MTPPLDFDRQNREYEELAIRLARGIAGDSGPAPHVLAESHWNLADEFVDRHGWTRAACGRRVKEDLISAEPTCEPCRAAVKAYNELNIA